MTGIEDEDAQRARDGKRLALALVAAATRRDVTAAGILLADCPHGELTIALQFAASLAASCLVKEVERGGLPQQHIDEVVRAWLLELERQ